MNRFSNTRPGCCGSGLPVSSRRDFLRRAGLGMGGLALGSLLDGETRAESPTIDPRNPLAVRPPHISAQVDRMIFLFQYGSPGQMDTFDYKPELQKRDGQPLPDSYKNDPKTAFVASIADKLMASPFGWKQRGQSGLWVSDLLPHMAECVDDMCVIRSMVSGSNNHAPSALELNTGVLIEGKPSMGSWLTYGLGSENQDLPGYVVLYEVGSYGGPGNWGNSFLPAAFGGVRFRDQGDPVFDLTPPDPYAASQRATIDLVQALNGEHQRDRVGHPELESRIASYELAYRMQAAAMDVGDLSGESTATRQLYGIDDEATARYGRKCLLARRLIERGVRVVQIYNGVADPKDGWDAHADLKGNHEFNARATDKPTAGLLKDLKSRGLLERTLVVWCGEFGRTPHSDGGRGRNHNGLAFSMWMAGGGVRGGTALGATDELGLHAVENPHTVHDLHATILTAFGMRPDDLFHEHNGRPERLTGVAGSSKVIPGVIR